MAARASCLGLWLVASSTSALTRRAALGSGGAAALSGRALGGGGAAASSSRVRRCAAPVGYYETQLRLDCGVAVPAAVWLPGDAATDTGDAAVYDYRISVGKLFRTFLGAPLPSAVGWSFPLAPSAGVFAAAPSRGAAARPAVVLAHGFLLRGIQIFNPTSMCAYATVSTQVLRLCFKNSTRAIDSSKNQPNRLRFDRARGF